MPLKEANINNSFYCTASFDRPHRKYSRSSSFLVLTIFQLFLYISSCESFLFDSIFKKNSYRKGEILKNSIYLKNQGTIFHDNRAIRMVSSVDSIRKNSNNEEDSKRYALNPDNDFYYDPDATIEDSETIISLPYNEKDRMYMRQALHLAGKALGKTRPNPVVGCVIVEHLQSNDNVEEEIVVGQGFHPKAGEPHAEVFAIRNAMEFYGINGKEEIIETNEKGEELLVTKLINKDLSSYGEKNLTAYVTLEPCNHYGRTPPCVDALVNAGVKRVVIGLIDPFPEVSGKGMKRLEENNIQVISSVEESKCKFINRPFLHRVQTMLTPEKVGGIKGQSLYNVLHGQLTGKGHYIPPNSLREVLKDIELFPESLLHYYKCMDAIVVEGGQFGLDIIHGIIEEESHPDKISKNEPNSSSTSFVFGNTTTGEKAPKGQKKGPLDDITLFDSNIYKVIISPSLRGVSMSHPLWQSTQKSESEILFITRTSDEEKLAKLRSFSGVKVIHYDKDKIFEGYNHQDTNELFATTGNNSEEIEEKLSLVDYVNKILYKENLLCAMFLVGGQFAKELCSKKLANEIYITSSLTNASSLKEEIPRYLGFSTSGDAIEKTIMSCNGLSPEKKCIMNIEIRTSEV